MDERDLLHCVTEMARGIGSQNWSGLAALYDPGYQGRRGLARHESAEEEIARLREETSAEGLTLKAYDLAPHVLSSRRRRRPAGRRGHPTPNPHLIYPLKGGLSESILGRIAAGTALRYPQSATQLLNPS